MTYKCITELVVTAAAACHTIVKKLKPLVYLHIFHNSLANTTSFTVLELTGTEFISAVIKIP